MKVIKSIKTYCKEQYQYELTIPGEKKALMKKDSNRINSLVTSIEVINAWANYYKHREEWKEAWVGRLAGPDGKLLYSEDSHQARTVKVFFKIEGKFVAWENMTKKQRENKEQQCETIMHLTAAGLDTNRNLAAIASLLGNSEYYRVRKYIDILHSWQRVLREEIEEELKNQGIV